MKEKKEHVHDARMAFVQSSSSTTSPYLTIRDIPIYFSEDWDTGIGGGLWSTGMAMAKYFELHAGSVCNNLKCLSHVKSLRESEREKKENKKENESDANIETSKGITALELGSGNGFLSVCLLALAANQNIPLKELVVTDMADHLSLMADTLKANSHVWDKLSVVESTEQRVGEGNGNENKNNEFLGTLAKNEKNESPTSKVATSSKDEKTLQSLVSVIAAEHRWGEQHQETNTISHQKYDFIFGTDLAYRNYLHEPLISSLHHFSHEHTVCLIGVTMTDTQPVFFDLLTKAGFRYEILAEHWIEGEFRGTNFGIFVIQRR